MTDFQRFLRHCSFAAATLQMYWRLSLQARHAHLSDADPEYSTAAPCQLGQKVARRPFFDYVGQAMPQFAPGTLTPKDNAPLPADGIALHAIIFEPAAAAKWRAGDSGYHVINVLHCGNIATKNQSSYRRFRATL